MMRHLLPLAAVAFLPACADGTHAGAIREQNDSSAHAHSYDAGGPQPEAGRSQPSDAAASRPRDVPLQAPDGQPACAQTESTFDASDSGSGPAQRIADAVQHFNSRSGDLVWSGGFRTRFALQARPTGASSTEFTGCDAGSTVRVPVKITFSTSDRALADPLAGFVDVDALNPTQAVLQGSGNTVADPSKLPATFDPLTETPSVFLVLRIGPSARDFGGFDGYMGVSTYHSACSAPNHCSEWGLSLMGDLALDQWDAG